jgi:hypothetical protein
MLDKTLITTVTNEDVETVVNGDKAQSEAIASLERLIGTVECYGTLNIVRPDFSVKADRTVAFELTMKRSA